MSSYTVISLGAGVQSTTMLLMALHGEFDRIPDCAIFADTGAEPERVYRHLEWLEEVAGRHRFSIYRAKAGNLMEDLRQAASGQRNRIANPPFYVKGGVLEKPEAMGALMRKCTREYKIDCIIRAIRERLLGLRPRQHVLKGTQVEQWIGISLDEAMRVKPSRHKYIFNRWPLIEKEMTRADCLEWLAKNGYPEPPKSACLFCPYHSDAVWQEIKMQSPKEWQQVVELDRAIRTSLPKVRGQVYLHRSLQPLDEVEFNLHHSDNQSRFENECEGMCGV
ncbi:hypothetical protein [Ferviditalea candida]|uniref:Phosphoadenosine phosphosulfate reductase n=1 Tax=Ferviditalea candida TaxID=3108399 RepID=A0ABU5ZM19_9BACL|nr:hypothetical protein [Paenibacillaceae bacterium T2]